MTLDADRMHQYYAKYCGIFQWHTPGRLYYIWGVGALYLPELTPVQCTQYATCKQHIVVVLVSMTMTQVYPFIPVITPHSLLNYDVGILAPLDGCAVRFQTTKKALGALADPRGR